MDKFEADLKKIPLAEPSLELRDRIFGINKERYFLKKIVFARLPVSWAAAIAVLMWLLGAFTSQLLQEAKLPANTVVNVQIIKSDSGANAFDFTSQPAANFLPGKLTVDIKSGEVF